MNVNPDYFLKMSYIVGLNVLFLIIHKYRLIMLNYTWVLSLLLYSINCYAQEKMTENIIKDSLVPVELTRVKIGGEIGRRIDITISNNLFRLNVDGDFLDSFRKKNDAGYIGLGKLIDGVTRMAAYTGNKKVDSLRNHLIKETINAQERDGYIGNMTLGNRMWELWDIHEMGYIIFGLITNYRLFGDIHSLNAAEKAADYIIKNWSAMPVSWEDTTKVAAHVAITGIHRTMLTLYTITNKKSYLDFCLNQLDIKHFEPDIVIGRRNLIEGHIYAYMALSLAKLELYRKEAYDKLTDQALKALHFMTSENGMAISGGAGQEEIWTDDQDGRGELGESCATVYQLRVYDNLLRLKSDARFGDIMERTIYNALFGAQSPDGRLIRYFTPLEGDRHYHNGDTYCCPCNYRRFISELPEMVYYLAGNGIAINLYTSSSADIRLEGGHSVTISQETDYPGSGHVVIRITPSENASFPVKLRIPSWCRNASISVNGKPSNITCKPGSFGIIERTWRKGDQVILEMPMEWRLVLGRERQAGRVAIMRGPLIFCLDPEQNESLAKMDAADLGRIVIDRAYIESAPVKNSDIRPEGIACRLKAGNIPFAMGNAGNLTLTLKEFADPKGKCTYFSTPDLSEAVPDELSGLW
jgi:uncharacterized protein